MDREVSSLRTIAKYGYMIFIIDQTFRWLKRGFKFVFKERHPMIKVSYDEEEFERLLISKLEQQLSRDDIDDAIAKYAGYAIEEAIADELQLFYRVGKGREIIKEAVLKRLGFHGSES